MPRRLLAVTAVVLLAGTVASACGGSGGAAPSSSAPSPSSTVTGSPPSTGPGVSPSAAPNVVTPGGMVAACNAVGVRRLPSTKGALVARLLAGSTVNVVETVAGEAYGKGSCGTAGDTWLKIDAIDGKAVQALYGADVLYAAAGFFR